MEEELEMREEGEGKKEVESRSVWRTVRGELVQSAGRSLVLGGQRLPWP